MFFAFYKILSNVSAYPLNHLCKISGCSLADIAEYRDDSEQPEPVLFRRARKTVSFGNTESKGGIEMKAKKQRAKQPRPGEQDAIAEHPIPDVYPELDTDLARDNLENDIPAADLQDL